MAFIKHLGVTCGWRALTCSIIIPRYTHTHFTCHCCALQLPTGILKEAYVKDRRVFMYLIELRYFMFVLVKDR